MNTNYLIPQDYSHPVLLKEANNPLTELLNHPVISIGSELLVNKALNVKRTSTYCDVHKEMIRGYCAIASDWVRYRQDDHDLDICTDELAGDVPVRLRFHIRSY